MTDSRSDEVVRIAAVGDIHCAKTAAGTLVPLFAQIAEWADILLLCGDLTDYGLADEARVLVKELPAGVKLPIIAVLGNHDYESNEQAEVRKILTDAGVIVLDGESCEVGGIGFAGVKGFAGGFGRGTLGAWGEAAVKGFVQEAIDEALRLETALARLRTPQKIAILHYAPIRATVENEPLEIFPFLGCSRLEEPLNRYPVTAVVHGHAHNGSPEGRTAAGIPVYNVSLPLLRKLYPDRPPFLRLEVPRPPSLREGGHTGGTEPMTGKIYHPEDKHPEPYQQDLNPDANAGQNYGLVDPHLEKKEGRRSAYDIKEIHRRLGDYHDDELKRIIVLPEGSRLEQGATYIDLRATPPREFTANGDMVATAEHWYVPKSEVDYPLWNRLIGVTDPARLDQATHRPSN